MARKTPRYLSLLPIKSVVEELILKLLQSPRCLRVSVTDFETLLEQTSGTNRPTRADGTTTGCRMTVPQHLKQYLVDDRWPSYPRMGGQTPP